MITLSNPPPSDPFLLFPFFPQEIKDLILDFAKAAYRTQYIRPFSDELCQRWAFNTTFSSWEVVGREGTGMDDLGRRQLQWLCSLKSPTEGHGVFDIT